jgi:hypothetical protein
MSIGVYRPEPLLRDQFIFLSASKPSRNLDRFPLAPARSNRTSVEIEEAVVSLARAVFAHDGRLVFGGHPSISPLVASVAAEYFPARHIASGQEPVWIYQSEAYREVIPESTQTLEKLGYARIHWIDKEGNEKHSDAEAGKEQCLKSMRRMREDMIDLNPGKGQPPSPHGRRPVAMVAIGGMEGVIREARLFLEKTPGRVYVLRTTAGAAVNLASHLQNNLLQEETPLSLRGWQNRVSVLEDIFSVSERESRAEDALPLAPYAVLMQRMVLHIAGKEPTESPGRP